VPFLARWPGRIPADRVSDAFIASLDLLPTLTKIVVGELPTRKIDGSDLSPLLLGEKDAKERANFVYYAGAELHAVREGRWKLHLPHETITVDGPPGRDGKPANFEKMKPDAIEQSGIRGIASRHGYRVEKLELALYDLTADVGETKNLAAQNPEIVKRLQALAEETRRELGDDITGVKGSGLRPAGRAERE